ncbi:Tyramine receptor tyra-2 [Aphelenchoides fujianensis]|nr:Tyramine receptor tyra-2 [Aphelenchoides fujianensis]
MLEAADSMTFFQALKSASLTILVLWTIVANALVFVVLYKNPRLQTVPNLLVGNLAFSDLCLALIVLPLSSVYAVAGKWLFNESLCVIFVSADILCSTASIWNLSIVGLDRYWAITSPVAYMAKRNKRTAAIMIVSVWVSSALISLAPLLGWKQVAEHGNLVQINGTWQCTFLDLPSYTIYSATGSFFIPIIVMFFVYFKIYQAFAKHRARQIYRQKVIRKHIESTILHEISHVLPTSDEFAKEEDEEESSGGGHSSGNSGSKENKHLEKNGMIVEEEEAYEEEDDSDVNPLDDEEEAAEESAESGGKDEDVVPETPTQITTALATCDQNSAIIRRNDLQPPPLLAMNGNSQQPRKPALKNGGTEKCVAFRKDSKKPKDKNSESAPIISYEKVKRHKQRKERNYRKSLQKKPRAISAAKERRGVKVLGIILGCFTICWTPFFLMYIIVQFCSSCVVNPHVEMAITWLGYSNSSLNPIIYSVFNRDYQIALRRLFFSEEEVQRRSDVQAGDPPKRLISAVPPIAN